MSFLTPNSRGVPLRGGRQQPRRRRRTSPAPPQGDINCQRLHAVLDVKNEEEERQLYVGPMAPGDQTLSDISSRHAALNGPQPSPSIRALSSHCSLQHKRLELKPGCNNLSLYLSNPFKREDQNGAWTPSLMASGRLSRAGPNLKREHFTA